MNKKVYKKEKIKPDLYVNIETGETLFSERGVITSVNKPVSDYVKMVSKTFFIIDDIALTYLKKVLSKADMYYVITIAGMAHGNYNILHDCNIVAHTKESLIKDLDLARVAFNRLLKKLYDKGVIYYIDGKKDGKRIKHIMLNPNLARRTNIIHASCINSFQTFD